MILECTISNDLEFHQLLIYQGPVKNFIELVILIMQLVLNKALTSQCVLLIHRSPVFS